MALRFVKSSSQYLYSSVTSVSSRIPMTLAFWFRKTSLEYWCAGISFGDIDDDDSFQAAQAADDAVRAIGWNNLATASYSTYPGTTNYHFIAAVFNSSTMLLYYDGSVRATNSSWTNNAISIDRATIGRVVSNTYTDYFDGYVEHVMAWTSALSTGSLDTLYDQSVNPLDVDSENLITYTPLIDDLTDDSGNLTWTSVNITSTSYETSGIEYPASGGATTITASDTGTGADAVFVRAKLTQADTGSGVDNATNSGMSYIVLSDTMSGVDAVRVFVKFLLGDTSSGSDTGDGKTYLYDGDTGTGTDEVTVGKGASVISVSDSATGTDEVVLKVFCRVSDSGTESDGDSIKAKIYAPETGSYDDTILAIKAYLNIGDSGLGNDDLKILAKLILGETGSAADYATKGGNAYVVLSDSGVGVDSISIKALLGISDSGSGVDADADRMTLIVSDDGVAVDNVSIKALLALADSGLTSDDISNNNPYKVLSDTGAFVDSIVVVGNGGIVENIYLNSPIVKTLSYTSAIVKTLSYTAVLQ